MRSSPDISAFSAAWDERGLRNQAEHVAFRRRLRGRLPALVLTLVRDFGARRIVLFGSLARDEARPGSDVDLLVSGIAPLQLVQATVEANRILGSAYVDLVDVNAARPEIAQRAAEEGEVLHG